MRALPRRAPSPASSEKVPCDPGRCAAPARITFIRIETRAFVESRGILRARRNENFFLMMSFLCVGTRLRRLAHPTNTESNREQTGIKKRTRAEQGVPLPHSRSEWRGGVRGGGILRAAYTGQANRKQCAPHPARFARHPPCRSLCSRREGRSKPRGLSTFYALSVVYSPSARRTMSAVSRERLSAAATRRKVASPRARRPGPSARQLLKAESRRAATCGFFPSSASAVSARKS